MTPTYTETLVSPPMFHLLVMRQRLRRLRTLPLQDIETWTTERQILSDACEAAIAELIVQEKETKETKETKV